MEPHDNHKVNLQKAINAHEEARATLADVIAHSPEPIFSEMLVNVERNIDALRSRAAQATPNE